MGEHVWGVFEALEPPSFLLSPHARICTSRAWGWTRVITQG